MHFFFVIGFIISAIFFLNERVPKWQVKKEKIQNSDQEMYLQKN